MPQPTDKLQEIVVMEYIDGYVAAVPNQNKDQYIRHARETAAIFKEYGALRLVECWGG